MSNYIQDMAMSEGAIEIGDKWAKFPSLELMYTFARLFLLNPVFEGTTVIW